MVMSIGPAGLSHDFRQYGLAPDDAKTFHRIVEDKLFSHEAKAAMAKAGSRVRPFSPVFDEDDSRWLTKLAGSAARAQEIVEQFGLQIGPG